MKRVKRNLLDFVCAFAIVLTVMICGALLTNAGLFDGAFVYDESKTSIEIFGKAIKLDERAVLISDKLLEFNDEFFGRGFSNAVKMVGKYAFTFASDVFTVLFVLARKLVGAE